MSTMFSNAEMLKWMAYFAENAEFDISHTKVLDITGKNRNLLPTVATNRSVLVFTDAGHPQIFYDMWDAGMGSCEIWYNEGSEPSGQIKHDKLEDMIDRGINASAAMLIINPDATSAFKLGMDNQSFFAGSIRYVGPEIRAVLMHKLHMNIQDKLLTVGAASIAVEAAMLASEGHVTAVEYSSRDRDTVDENITKFGLHNVSVFPSVSEALCAVAEIPDTAFLVISDKVEEEIKALHAVNKEMKFVFYSLNFDYVCKVPSLLNECGIKMTDMLQIQISKRISKGNFEIQPAPWIITAG